MKKLVISLLGVVTILTLILNVSTPKEMQHSTAQNFKMVADGDTG